MSHKLLKDQLHFMLYLACITEQTHKIRFVCMMCLCVCDSIILLSRTILRKLIMNQKQCTWSASIYSLRTVAYSYPNVFCSCRSQTLSQKSYAIKVNDANQHFYELKQFQKYSIRSIMDRLNDPYNIADSS